MHNFYQDSHWRVHVFIWVLETELRLCRSVYPQIRLTGPGVLMLQAQLSSWAGVDCSEGAAGIWTQQHFSWTRSLVVLASLELYVDKVGLERRGLWPLRLVSRVLGLRLCATLSGLSFSCALSCFTGASGSLERPFKVVSPQKNVHFIAKRGGGSPATSLPFLSSSQAAMIVAS